MYRRGAWWPPSSYLEPFDRNRSCFAGEQLPGLWNPFELMLASALQLDPGADQEILHRTGHQHLARAGQGA